MKHLRPFFKAIVSCAIVLTIFGGTVSTARADTAGQVSTRNIALEAVALAAGIILYNNYQHKAQYANSVVGYTRDGGVVYGDGRIVYPNNITAYATNNGSQVCSFNGVGVPCRPTHLSGHFRRGYTPPCWPPGHCKEYWKKHQHDHDNDNHDNDNHDDHHPMTSSSGGSLSGR
jgi:hypothetical protein